MLVAGWLDFAPPPSNQLRVSRRDGFTRAEEKAQEGGPVRKAAHSHSCGEWILQCQRNPYFGESGSAPWAMAMAITASSQPSQTAS